MIAEIAFLSAILGYALLVAVSLSITSEVAHCLFKYYQKESK